MTELFLKSLVIAALCSPQLIHAHDFSFGRKFERLSDELQLTADQKAQMESIFNEKHEKFRAIREDTQRQIEAVLTPEQLLKLESDKKLSRDKFHSFSDDSP